MVSRTFAAIRQVLLNHPDATVYALYVLIVCVWFRGLILDPGFLGLRDDWPIPPTSWQNVQIAQVHQQAWVQNYFGLSWVERNMSLYILWICGFAAQFLGADGWLISRYPMVLIALAAIFAYQSARTFGMRRRPAFVVGLTYASTPFMFDAYITGYMPMFVGMAVLPKALASAHLAFERPLCLRRLCKGMVWIGLSASTIHLAVLTVVMIAGYCVYRIAFTPGKIIRKFKTVTYIVAMGSGILLFHPAAAIVAYQTLFLPDTLNQLAAWSQTAKHTWVSGVAPRFSEALTLVGAPYNYSVGRDLHIGHLPVIYMVGRAALTSLAFLAVILTRGRERSLAVFLLTGFLILALLGKGSNEPFSLLHQAFQELPGSSLFRNVRYFSIPASLMLALMVGLAVNTKTFSTHRLNNLLAVTIGVLLLAGSLSFWSGNLFGYLRPYQIDSDTINAATSIRTDPGDYRMLHLPMTGPAAYRSTTGTISPPGDNPFIEHPPKPTIKLSPQPSFFPQYFSTVYHALLDPARYPIQALLNFGRIGYVLFDPHWVTRYASFISTNGEPWLADYETIERLTVARAQQAGLVGDASLSEGSVHVARVHNSNGQRLSTPDRVVLSSPSLRHLSTASFAFPGNLQITHLQGPYARPPASYNLASEIWLDADPLDTVFLFVPPQYVFEPGLQIRQNSSDASREWVATYRNAWWYLNSDIADATKSIITKASKASFQMSLTSQAGDHELWIRHFVSPQGSSLAFSLHDTALTSIPTMATDAYGYVWTKLPLPPLVPGNHTLHIATEDAGLNAVSQVVLVPQNIVYNARDRATQSLANLPLGLVLPDLEKTDGNRRFSLPISGSFHLDTLVPDTFNPTLAIDGNPVTFTESDSPAPGKKRLTAEVQLEAGSHILTLQPSSPLPPVSIETLTSPFQSGGSNSSCDDAPCSGAVRYLVTANSDGRTLTFDGRLHVGQYQVLAQAWQIKPQVVHYNQIHMDHQATNDISVTVPLDPGSSQALLDVRQHLGSDALLDFELLAVEQSLLPHGISITLSQVQLPTTSIAGIRLSDAANPTHISGVYEGPSGRRIVRLDEKFDLRWILTINGVKVDPSAHIALDGHFNGWVVDLPSGATVRASFAVQNAHFGIQVANLTLLFLAVLAGWQPWNLLHRQPHPTPE